MYKVFFNDRTVFLTDDFSSSFKVRHGLFFKYKEEEDLEEIIDVYSKLSRVKALTLFHYDIDKLRDDFRKCFVNIDAAGGLVKNQNNEYLMIFRRGKWDLPKGKVDSGEIFPQAALREVSEETGLKAIQIEKPLLSTYHTYPYKGKIALKKTFWFMMNLTGEEEVMPQTEEDIEEVRWFKKEELKEPLQNTFPLIEDVFKYTGII